MLTGTDITVRYGRLTAVSDVTVSLAEGVTGLLGPNGAGKSTLLRVLATVRKPDVGSVSLDGIDPTSSGGSRREYRSRLGYLPQEFGFYPYFTVERFAHHVALLKLTGSDQDRSAAVEDALRDTDLVDLRSTRIRKLSGGMRRRLGLACATIGAPDAVILDEPTVGLDPAQRILFREMIARMGADRCVLLSTHQTDDVSELCNRVLVLIGGRITFDGTPAELRRVAEGQVWLSYRPDDTARATWMTGEGRWRSVGGGAEGDLVAPTVEDGYLLICGTMPDPNRRKATS